VSALPAFAAASASAQATAGRERSRGGWPGGLSRPG